MSPYKKGDICRLSTSRHFSVRRGREPSCWQDHLSQDAALQAFLPLFLACTSVIEVSLHLLRVHCAELWLLSQATREACRSHTVAVQCHSATRLTKGMA